MKASEAIKILEGLDPSHEVTLTIGSKRSRSYGPYPAEFPIPLPYIPQWVEQTEFWPQRNVITCKMH